jgi:hypothetical protein
VLAGQTGMFELLMRRYNERLYRAARAITRDDREAEDVQPTYLNAFSKLRLTLAEAVARLEGRYADDIAAYETVHRQILHMADMPSDGIIAQFPQKFSGAR